MHVNELDDKLVFFFFVIRRQVSLIYLFMQQSNWNTDVHVTIYWECPSTALLSGRSTELMYKTILTRILRMKFLTHDLIFFFFIYFSTKRRLLRIFKLALAIIMLWVVKVFFRLLAASFRTCLSWKSINRFSVSHTRT